MSWPQFAAGFETGCKLGNAIYPLDCASIAPVQTDANQQISQIEAKLAAGEIDCISIEPVTSDFDDAIVNKLMDQGIPVFTDELHLARPRIHQFHPNTAGSDGETAGKIVLRLDEGQ